MEQPGAQRLEVTAAGMPIWRRAWAVDLAFVVVLATAALLVRVVDLTEFPRGLHGDEAWTVLDARDIIDGESKWPYTEAALGQPAGPMYWSVPFEAIWGPSILAARLPQVVLGVLTVAVGFYAAHVLFGRIAAWIWAVLAAFSSWLIFYNRTGFTVSAFPLTEMAALLALGLALRKRWWPWYVAAGIVIGAGLYGYFSYPLFAAGLGVYVLAHLAVEQPRPLWLHVRNITVMGLVALLVIMPMRPYFFDDTTGYSADRTGFAVSNTEKYENAETTLEKVDVYRDNVIQLGKTLVWNGWQDASDGSGDVSALDYSVSLLAAFGLFVSLWAALRTRRVVYLLPWIMIPAILIGPAYSAGGYHRRSLGILVFVLMLAALPLSQLVEWSAGRNRRGWFMAATAGCVAVLAVSTASNLYRYFEQMRDTRIMLFTFAPEITAAAEWTRDQPELPVYLFAERWSANHETVRYLLPDHARIDRSDSFAEEGARSLPALDPADGGIILLISHANPRLDYIARYDDAARAMYPEATRYEGEQIGGRPSFVAYVIGG